ncbi:hypothetical protein evm_011093 [Chilo suppressalis]|nr:hypothetical protein evm_011093 [Chilo suppressalis]
MRVHVRSGGAAARAAVGDVPIGARRNCENLRCHNLSTKRAIMDRQMMRKGVPRSRPLSRAKGSYKSVGANNGAITCTLRLRRAAILAPSPRGPFYRLISLETFALC